MFWSSWDPQLRIFDFIIEELACGLPPDIDFFGDNRCSDYGDILSSDSVFAWKFHIELADGTVDGEVTEFFIHVVVVRSRRETKGDAVGFDASVVFFEDLL